MQPRTQRLFIYEAICAGAYGLDAPPSLRNEGWAMLTALVEDFKRVPAVETLTLLNAHCPRPVGAMCRRIDPVHEHVAFAELAASADWILLIAPESHDCLAERCRWVTAAGKPLLGPNLSAIELTADKWTLAQHFRKHGVPTPATALLQGGACHLHGHGASESMIVKPRHGAGSQATFLVNDENQVLAALAAAQAEHPGDDFLLQTHVAGQAVSVSFIVGPRQTIALAPAAQTLSADGRFTYLGGWLPLPAPLARRAQTLARQAIGVIPGLSGLLGVDMVLGSAEDGSCDWVIEVNPRPTTSYIGLRRLAADNLADILWRAAQGKPVAPPRWRDTTVMFNASAAD